MDCAELEAVAAELALGIADGAERAAAISHLAHCPKCRELIEDLGRVTDDLLLLAPQVEPPIGFEGRVQDRIAASAPRPRQGFPRQLRLLAAAAAVILAAVGGLVAGHLSAGRARTAAVNISQVRAGNGLCRVMTIKGHPSELVVRLDEPGEEGADYTVAAVPASGAPAITLGALHLRDGRGALDAAVPSNAGMVTAVRVTDDMGVVRYHVTFPAV